MGELGEQSSSIKVKRTFPSTWNIISVIAIPVAVDLHHQHITNDLLAHNLFEPFAWRTIAILLYYEYLARHLQSGEDHILTIFLRQRHRLFYDNIEMLLESFNGERCMQTIWSANINDIGFATRRKKILDRCKPRVSLE